jgi:hypothetical protein
MAFKISDTTVIDNSRNFINALAVGIGTTNPTSKLWVDGDGYFTGVTTASQFVSNVAQGTAPLTVTSTTLVPNLNVQYLNGQSGAYYNSANNLTGTAPGGVISQSSGLTITGNLSVSGNVSVGGTSFLVNAGTLQVKDKDIVLGITTNALNQDVSTDTTANHGGVAIASTEGTPLIDINGGVGTDSIPPTYKQIMWLKSGSWTGLGTDAWLFNYGVGIGSTQVPNGVRLAVGGVQFTQNDLAVVRNINASGIVTAANGFNASSSSDYEINGTSVLNSTTLGSGVVNSSLTSVGTLPTLNATNITNTNINSTGIHSAATYNVGATTVLSTVSSQIRLAGIATIDATTRATLERELAFAPNDFDSLTVSGISTFNNNVHIPSSSVGIGTTNPLQRLQVGTANTLGINTNGTVFVVTSNADVGIGTTNPTSKLHVIGDGRFTGVITATTFIGTLSGFASTAGVSTSVIGGIASVTQLSVSGVSTFNNNVHIPSSSVGIGTTNPLQRLQVGTANTLGINTNGTVFVVTSNADVGIGTTNPQAKLDVNGSVRFRSSITDNNNATGSANQVLTATSAGAGVSWATLTATSVGAISAVTVTNDTATTTPLFPIFTSSTGTSITGVNVDTTGLTFIPTGSGSLGIGTTSPTRNLDVNGDARIRGGIYDVNNTVGAANSVLTANGSGGWSWQPVVSGGGGAISGINVTQDDTGVRYPLLAAGTNSATTAQYVDATALVYNTLSNCLGIGSTTPTSRLDIIGDVKVVGIVTASDFNSSSDIKLKTNIQRIANPIEKVLQINGVSFNWKESGKATMGVIAQEVEAVLPELVSDTDPKSVNYNGLIGLLIECAKDQQRQIDELRNIT